MLTYFKIKSNQEIRILSNFKVIYKFWDVLKTLEMRPTLFKVIMKKICIHEVKTIYQKLCDIIILYMKGRFSYCDHLQAIQLFNQYQNVNMLNFCYRLLQWFKLDVFHFLMPFKVTTEILVLICHKNQNFWRISSECFV